MGSPGTPAAPTPVGLSAVDLAELVGLVALRTGVDLGGQRDGVLARRAAGRIAASGARSAAEYLEVLRRDASEPWRLLERLTIKVSRLFRNPATFAFLATRVIPELRRARGARPLRAWSAGCACGEEAYGLAMLCDAGAQRWSVVGTDVDNSALARARAATYPAAHAADVPSDLAERHLARRADGAVAIRPELARRVRFAAHDLLSAAPPPGDGRFDLVACRNVLIYYVAERQARILATLLRSLAPGGYLVLGEAEWPAALAARLEVVDRSCRVFKLAGAREGSA